MRDLILQLENEEPKQGKVPKLEFIDFEDFLNAVVNMERDRIVNAYLSPFIDEEDRHQAYPIKNKLQKLKHLSLATEYNESDVKALVKGIDRRKLKNLIKKFNSVVFFMQLHLLKSYAVYVNPSTKPLYICPTFKVLIPLTDYHISYEGVNRFKINLEHTDGIRRFKGLNMISYDVSFTDTVHRAFEAEISSSTTQEELNLISKPFLNYSENDDQIAVYYDFKSWLKSYDPSTITLVAVENDTPEEFDPDILLELDLYNNSLPIDNNSGSQITKKLTF